MLTPITSLFHIDALSIVMICLVAFIGSIVVAFASRYLRGDRQYTVFLGLLTTLITTVILLSMADNVALFFVLWALTNGLLLLLMTHYRRWPQAAASGWIAAKYLGTGTLSLGLGLGVLSLESHCYSIHQLIHTSLGSPFSMVGLGLIAVAAFAQSAIFPFHKWLISSLNSPTPVSAIMHAGIINGGGVLLTRFAPLFLTHTIWLTIMVVIGTITAAFGTSFKLVQPDVKRMLACSTLGQMGFMIVQCGLGLFPAAISHLLWHGMFKAYFFLDSASAGQYPKLNKPESPSLINVMLSVTGGAVAAIITMGLLHISIHPMSTTIIIAIVVGITGTQGMLTFLQRNGTPKAALGIGLSAIIGLLYGVSVRLIEHQLEGLHILLPQSFTWLHGMVSVIFIGLWATIAIGPIVVKLKLPRLYVWVLNQSQPDPSTITTHRTHYTYE